VAHLERILEALGPRLLRNGIGRGVGDRLPVRREDVGVDPRSRGREHPRLAARRKEVDLGQAGARRAGGDFGQDGDRAAQGREARARESRPVAQQRASLAGGHVHQQELAVVAVLRQVRPAHHDEGTAAIRRDVRAAQPHDAVVVVEGEARSLGEQRDAAAAHQGTRDGQAGPHASEPRHHPSFAVSWPLKRVASGTLPQAS
jgi:hypothetical protein